MPIPSDTFALALRTLRRLATLRGDVSVALIAQKALDGSAEHQHCAQTLLDEKWGLHEGRVAPWVSSFSKTKTALGENDAYPPHPPCKGCGKEAPPGTQASAEYCPQCLTKRLDEENP